MAEHYLPEPQAPPATSLAYSCFSVEGKEIGMPEDYFEQKVNAATQSISRARAVFLISNIAAIIVVAANFNLYFSWLRNMIARPVDPAYAEVLKAIDQARIEDTTIISVPLIGVKFFAADIGILSALSMLVLSLWMYYAFRREQHTIGRIVFEVLETDPPNALTGCRVSASLIDKAQYLLYALSSAFVFTTSTRGRLAIGDPSRSSDKQDLRATRAMSAIMLWAPCWTVILSLFLDIGSMFFPSSVLSGPPLATVLAEKQRTEAYLRFIATGLLALLIGWIVKNATYYDAWTSRVYSSLAKAVEDAEASAATSATSHSPSRNIDSI